MGRAAARPGYTRIKGEGEDDDNNKAGGNGNDEKALDGVWVFNKDCGTYTRVARHRRRLFLIPSWSRPLLPFDSHGRSNRVSGCKSGTVAKLGCLDGGC